MPKEYTLENTPGHWIGRFNAMACPCEILIDADNKELAEKVTQVAFNEAKRIEQKFSRYLTGNIVYKINHSNGKTISVDNETADMLDFANQCYELSEGKFDITSGVLREAWKFDGSNNIPSQKTIDSLKPKIGWDKVSWQRPNITLQPGMEIDLGGLGKEYSVDQTAKLIQPLLEKGVLVNFGGDIFSFGPIDKSTPWRIGIDDSQHTGSKTKGEIKLYRGGLATSGDARRFLLKNDIRYGHILNPLTGWSVPDAPASVTVISDSCLMAGMLSTFAMLEGSNADAFLKEQDVRYYCQWD
jgi:FAD:protein FMN transferase